MHFAAKPGRGYTVIAYPDLSQPIEMVTITAETANETVLIPTAGAFLLVGFRSAELTRN